MGDNELINPNDADINTLQKIPGVGPVLAQRIISARPFNKLDDLRKVQGISDLLISQIAPHLTLAGNLESTVNEEEFIIEKERGIGDIPLEPELEGEVLGIWEEEYDESDSEEMMREKLPPVEKPENDILDTDLNDETDGDAEISDEEELIEKPERKTKPKSSPKYVELNQAIWLVFGTGLLSFTLALVISLGILAVINGGRLVYANPAQVRDLSQELETLNSSLGTLEEDIKGLRTRVDNLETVSNRVSNLEESLSDTQSGLAEAETRLTEIGTQIEDFGAQILALEEHSSRIETFFNELGQLILGIFPVEGE